MDTKYLLSIALFLSISSHLFSQNISGTVTSTGGDPLPYVSVIDLGSNVSTLSDSAGKYSIPVKGEHIRLKFSLMGFTEKEVHSASSNTECPESRSVLHFI